MKNEEAVCDICNDRVAKRKCAICGKDLCGYCGKDWFLSIGNENKITIPFCKKCLNNKYDKEVLEAIKNEIVDKMKKGKIIQGLA